MTVISKRKTTLLQFKMKKIYILFLVLLPIICTAQKQFQRIFDSKSNVVLDPKSEFFKITGAALKSNGTAVMCKKNSQNGLLISEIDSNYNVTEKFYLLEEKWVKEYAVLSLDGNRFYMFPSNSGFYLVDQNNNGNYYSYLASTSERGSDIFITGNSSYATKDYKTVTSNQMVVPGIQKVSHEINILEMYPDLKAQVFATKATYVFVSDKNSNYLNNYNNFFYPNNLELVYFSAEEDGKVVQKNDWIQKPNLLRLESQSLGKMTIKLLFKEKECLINDISVAQKSDTEIPTATKTTEVKIYSDKITIAISDNATADGDVISLELNGKVIVQNLRLDKCSSTFDLQLSPGENTLCMKAITVGAIPPNTALLTLTDVIQKKSIVLKAKPNYFECLTLIR